MVFRLPFLFSLINQKPGDENNINAWHQEPHFIQNQKPTLQALTLHTYGFAPLTRWRCDHRKGALFWHEGTEETAPYISFKTPESFSRIIFRGSSKWLE